MNEKEELIVKLKTLLVIHDQKQKAHQEKYNLSPDCGCITRESCKIFALLPQMQRLGVRLDECI